MRDQRAPVHARHVEIGDQHVHRALRQDRLRLGGVDFASALRVIPAIYRNVSAGSCEMEIDRRNGIAIARLRGIWDWPDAWQVGLFEGGLLAFREVGTVRVRNRSLCEADLEIRWSQRPPR